MIIKGYSKVKPVSSIDKSKDSKGSFQQAMAQAQKNKRKKK